MQFISLVVLTLVFSILEIQIKLQNCSSALVLSAPSALIGAPAAPTASSLDAVEQDDSTTGAHAAPNPTKPHSDHLAARKQFDPYEYRYIFAEGVQNALDECRERFRWDRWNCPKKLFLDILERNPLPSNRELAYLRALIASSVVLSVARSCSINPNKANCGCTYGYSSAANPSTRSIQSTLSKAVDIHNPNTLQQSHHPLHHSTGSPANQPNPHHRQPAPNQHLAQQQYENDTAAKFAWQGCDESIKFAFKVSKVYLDTLNSLDSTPGSGLGSGQPLNGHVVERINARNFEAGRAAVRKNLHKICKCHGVSGSCQVQHCWTGVPSLSQVGAYLRRQYNYAAKVGATNSEETELTSLDRELAQLSSDKLVFADPSPDYCYENPQLGINGTLARYCSRNKTGLDGKEVSRSERDSCDRLCTKCGYRVKREIIQVEKQCDCRFKYCCTVECKRCQQNEMTYKGLASQQQLQSQVMGAQPSSSFWSSQNGANKRRPV